MVPQSTLGTRVEGVAARGDTKPNSKKLPDLEESTLVEYILGLDARSFLPRLRVVEEIANRLLADHDASPVGTNWASKFVKRRKELYTRFTRRYDYQRVLCENPDLINAWFQLVRNTIAKIRHRGCRHVQLQGDWLYDRDDLSRHGCDKFGKTWQAKTGTARKWGMGFCDPGDQFSRLGDPTVHHPWRSASPHQLV